MLSSYIGPVLGGWGPHAWTWRPNMQYTAFNTYLCSNVYLLTLYLQCIPIPIIQCEDLTNILRVCHQAFFNQIFCSSAANLLGKHPTVSQ